MNLKTIPILAINLVLIISIIFFGNDARTIIILFFAEIIIFSLFRAVRFVREPNRALPGHLSTKTTSIMAAIVAPISIFIFMLIASDVRNGGMIIIWSALKQNIWFIASIVVLEFVSMLKYFHDKPSKDYTLVLGVAKILFAIFLMLFLGLIINIIEILGMILSIIGLVIKPHYNAPIIAAVIFVISKTFIDCLFISKETEK